MNANSAAALSLFTFVIKEFCYTTTTREENVKFSFIIFFIWLFFSQLFNRRPIEDRSSDECGDLNGSSRGEKKARDNGSNAGIVGSTPFLLANLAHKKNLVIERVTSTTAASVQNELCRKENAELTRLVQGRLTPTFVYDFFSCVAGKYLKNSSLLRGQVPSGFQYLPGGNFYWSNVHIYVVRSSTVKRGRSGSIQGLCVFHDAYLSSYPGPNNFFHTVDPVLTKTSRTKYHRNLGVEFNDSTTKGEVMRNGRGSRMWCDIPVLAGPGVGRVVLAHSMETRCNVVLEGEDKNGVNFFVRVSGGENNIRMHSLLMRFGFNRLYLSHPVSKEPWLDEAGDELFVMSRKNSIEPALASTLLSCNLATAVTQPASPKSRSTSKKKACSPSRRRKRL